MSAPPSDFSAATFLYLNPEVTAFSNVITVEDAYDRYADEFSHLPYELPRPEAFDAPHAADVYIAQFRDVIDVSGVNRTIRLAYSNVLGGDAVPETGGPFGRYVANFYRKIALDAGAGGSNVFTLLPVPTSLTSACGNLNADNVKLNSSNMRVGDAVKIIKNDGRSLLYGNVAEILDDETFRIEPSAHDLDNVVAPITRDQDGQDDYILYGIHVLDPDRVAHVNFTRRYLQGFSNETPLLVMEPFNVELYQILYPDSRFLTEEEAFVSSRNNWSTADCRITKASDILNTNDPVTENLVVSSNLVLTSNAVLTWDGFVLTDVSRDDVTASCNVPSSTLITEKAIKKYVERPYNTTAVFSNVVVQGAIDLTGDLTMGNGDVSACNVDADTLNVGDSNLVVDDSSARLLKSDLEVTSNIVCTSSTFANMMFAGARVAIGGGQDSVDTWPDALQELTRGGNQDRAAENLEVKRKLLLGPGGGVWQLESRAHQGGGGSGGEHFALAHASALAHPLLALTSNQPQGGRGGMFFDGDIFASGTLLSLSDARHKKDVRRIEGALDKVDLLDGCTFLRVHDPDGARRGMGLIAQDVEKVIPEAVEPVKGKTSSLLACHDGNNNDNDNDCGDTLLGVSYGNLCGLLVEAVKELRQDLRETQRQLRRVMDA